MEIRCIIVDDEPLAVRLLEAYVSRTPYLRLLGSFSSGLEVLGSSVLDEVDLVFLDIQMPGMTGLEMSKAMRSEVRIIFTTAFSDYAIESYKVNAIDYLLKPITYEDFIVSVQRAYTWFDMKNKCEERKEEERGAIYVKSEYKLLRIDLQKLLYVEGMKDYVKFYIEGEAHPIISLMNMKKAESILPVKDFLRVHRSYIVRKDKVCTIERGRIVYGKERIPIGDTYKDALNILLDL